MGKIIFILGGARSGKSRFALELAIKSKRRKVAFIATAEIGDGEMKKRVLLHRLSRPGNFETFEEAYNLSGLLKKNASTFDVIIIDCLTLFVSNLMLKRYGENKILDEISKVLEVLKKTNTKTIVVSNEVGLGIVPQTKLGRNFRDVAGKVNQVVARNADNVFFMVSGLPLKVK
jgi:adenosylcobinamide kinase/adenosylcobinamide-phosphate guanylyltransferase